MTDYYAKYVAYLDSTHWKLLRAEKIAQQNFCYNCKTDKQLRVHHINYRNLTDCTLDDLATLCEECHDTLHVGLKIENKKSCECPLEGIPAMILAGKMSPRERRNIFKQSKRRLKKEKKEKKVKEKYVPAKPQNAQIRAIFNRRLSLFQQNKKLSRELVWKFVEDITEIATEFYPCSEYDHLVSLIGQGIITSEPDPF